MSVRTTGAALAAQADRHRAEHGRVGLGTAALLIHLFGPHHTGFVIAAPLLLAGIGGGAVISPNTTLTLECVPTRMAGAAGGALQTGQRVGTAIGTAVLTAVFRMTASTTKDYPASAAIALAAAVGFMVVALVIAVVELRRRARTPRAGQRAEDSMSAREG